MTPRWALCAAAIVTACHRHEAAEAEEVEPGPARVRCEAVAPGTLRETRVLRGSVQLPPDRLARVAAQVPGRVLRLVAREGDRVAAGALLAEVEASPFVDESTVARGELEAARLAVSTAAATEARLVGLVARGVAAQQELDDARVRLAEARSSLAQRVGAASQARRSLSRARLVAPLGGVVLRVLRGVGDLVDGTPATPVVEVGDPSAMAFAANALAGDLASMRAGQGATVRVGSLDAPPWEAHVERVSPAVDVATGIGTVWLRLDAPQAVTLGATGVAQVVTDARDAVLAVPEAALRARDGDHAEVVLCVERAAKVRAVTLGASSEGRVEVREGLAAGERVVVDQPAGLEDDGALEAQP